MVRPFLKMRCLKPVDHFSLQIDLWFVKRGNTGDTKVVKLKNELYSLTL